MSSAIYICIKQFNARLGDELSLKVGDKVEVIADDSEYNDGWYMGKNLLTNEVGLYPNTFTQLLVSEEPERDLLRSRSRSRHIGAASTTPSTADSGNSPTSGGPTGLGISGANTTPTIPEHDTEPILDKFSKLNVIDNNTNLNNEIDKALKEIKESHPTPDTTIASKDSMFSFSTSTRTMDEEIGILEPSQAITWSPKEVSTYFLRRGFDNEVANKFYLHKITGEILFQLELSHLKELEINSFGTRFEINKEIEMLRGLIKKPKLDSRKTSSQSTSSTHKDTISYNSPPTAATTLVTEERTTDEFNKPPQQQQQLMPSVILSPQDSSSPSFKKTHQKTRSQSVDDIVKPSYTPRSDSFMSPRKAPEPPTSNSGSPLNTSFKFGGGSAGDSFDPRQHSVGYMTRTKASDRPGSTLYEASHNKRTDSTKRSTSPHKRHSSLFSFLSDTSERKTEITGVPPLTTTGPNSSNGLKSKSPSPVDIDDAMLSPKKKTLPRLKTSNLFSNNNNNESSDEQKSDPSALSNSTPSVSRLKGFRSSSTQNFKNLTTSKKSKTSAFTEGIREVTPGEAIKTASFSGWMSKRSGNTLAWRSRYFTLHGTRLSYFTSLKDRKEKGLIDITAHKVLPISTDSDSDKYTALYASSTLQGSYCFKVVPPAPGFKKGLTFTQPKTHYFAVNSEEEMRGWMKALMTATIDIDDSVPVVSSCSTPVVSLGKAQEMLAKAREETKLKDEELRAQGYIRVGDDYDDSTTNSSINGTAASATTSTALKKQSKVSLEMSRSMNSPTTPGAASGGGGFSSPYMLAGGIISSPKPQTPSEEVNTAFLGMPQMSSPTISSPLGFGVDSLRPNSMSNSQPESAVTMSSSDDSKTSLPNTSKESSGGTKKPEKLLAYSSDGSGNHTFVIKSKK
ncbi:Protein BOI2 [Spathaspora sp. JA1]|nr:Protein BOI2 [Spathaspora sp. JA1]